MYSLELKLKRVQEELDLLEDQGFIYTQKYEKLEQEKFKLIYDLEEQLSLLENEKAVYNEYN